MCNERCYWHWVRESEIISKNCRHDSIPWGGRSWLVSMCSYKSCWQPADESVPCWMYRAWMGLVMMKISAHYIQEARGSARVLLLLLTVLHGQGRTVRARSPCTGYEIWEIKKRERCYPRATRKWGEIWHCAGGASRSTHLSWSTGCAVPEMCALRTPDSTSAAVWRFVTETFQIVSLHGGIKLVTLTIDKIAGCQLLGIHASVIRYVNEKWSSWCHKSSNFIVAYCLLEKIHR